jgi:hypothetical protein
MARLYVESWAPEYGSSFESDPALADEGKVDETVEVDGPWLPLPGHDDGVTRVAFVDGVRRIDARLTLDDPDGPVPGICGTHGVGAVLWDRLQRRSCFQRLHIDRLAVFGNGKGAPVPGGTDRIVYRSESVPESDPGALIQRFHGSMRIAEARLSEELAREGEYVIADGPINDLSATEKVGYIKSHRAPYLSAERSMIVGRLQPGERTPLFLIGKGGAYPRYSWYQRLARLPGGHSWTGVVRCELSSALPLATATRVADCTAAILPRVASAPHIDPRAPQNLVPIAALERELRRLLGDAGLIYRALRTAATAVPTGAAP